VVVVAVPYAARGDAAADHPEQLASKVVVDITNPPVDSETMDRLLTPPDISAAEQLAQRLGDRAPVIGR
jgi:8-hydroxy-5-deazaflavin:NADPH oxidoreductase